jgi:3D (Asp-Asp-Asp) domain-containing protein
MHPESMYSMNRLLNKYVTEDYLKDKSNPLLIDFGSATVEDQSDSYKKLPIVSKFKYQGIDVAPGKNVDIVMSDPYVIPLGDNVADVTISGQAFEHIEFFWVSFLELVRVTKKDCIIIVTAPSGGYVHRHPVDCWRFFPDAMPALAKWGKVEMLETFIAGQEWGDNFGVFKK